MNDDFVALIEKINQCNKDLYAEAAQYDAKSLGDEVVWEQSTHHMNIRGKLLTQLDSMSPYFTPEQVNLVGELYQLMLADDQKCMAIAQNEANKTRGSLRKIKKAAKAETAYSANVKNSLR